MTNETQFLTDLGIALAGAFEPLWPPADLAATPAIQSRLREVAREVASRSPDLFSTESLLVDSTATPTRFISHLERLRDAVREVARTRRVNEDPAAAPLLSETVVRHFALHIQNAVTLIQAEGTHARDLVDRVMFQTSLAILEEARPFIPPALPPAPGAFPASAALRDSL